MLTFLRQCFLSSIVRRLYFDSSKFLQPHFKNYHLRPANYSNALASAKPIGLKVRCGLQYSIIRLQHNEVRIEILDPIRKFEDLLREIDQNQNDLSVDTINSYINEIGALLEDLAFEEHHGVKLLQNKSFTALFKAINKSIDKMSLTDINSILLLCKDLHIPFNVQVCLEMIKKLKLNFQDLDFTGKVGFWFSLAKLIVVLEDKTEVQKLINNVAVEIMKDVKSNVYLNSTNNVAAALAFIHFYLYVPHRVENDVLSAVLDLKTWDSHRFLRYFIKTESRKKNAPPLKLYKLFLERIQQEIAGNNPFLHHFLCNYTEGVNKYIIDYNRNLVDDTINKILLSRVRTKSVELATKSLLKLRHCHYGFMEHLTDFLKRNPLIYVSHPVLSSYIIGYIAAHYGSIKDKNLGVITKSVLKDNPNLIQMLRFQRDDLNSYVNSIINLTSLEIFIDEELNQFPNLLLRKKFRSCHGLLQKQLMTLNQSLKVLHPNFSNSLLSSEDISIGINLYSKGNPDLFPTAVFLDVIKKHLQVASGVTDCVLKSCSNKLGYKFDGFVAVNSEGEFHNFEPELDTEIFVEDISLPTGFNLVALLLIFQGQQVRNTLHLTQISSMRLKVNELLGFPTVVIYESTFKNLNDDEKGKYLKNIILEKMWKKEEEKNVSIET